jgi:hypothetical protein
MDFGCDRRRFRRGSEFEPVASVSSRLGILGLLGFMRLVVERLLGFQRMLGLERLLGFERLLFQRMLGRRLAPCRLLR